MILEILMSREISPSAYMSAWASARTLFTFCVNENEIGKIYASVGIMASVAPLISDPMFRTLYNKVIYLPHYFKLTGISHTS